MYKTILILLILLGFAFTSKAHNDAVDSGLASYESPYSVAETAKRFKEAAQAKGLTVFTSINHQQNAQDAGLTLAPTIVIIFGNPKVGTPLMQCAPNVAIDLPQKALIREDKHGKVWLIYNDPKHLKKRHQIRACEQELAKVSEVLSALAKNTTANSSKK